MSVLIKGMVMPQNCDACPMLYEYRFCALTDDHASSIEWKMEENRMPNCPLIELPDHGDLIDRDELKYDLNLLYDAIGASAYGFALGTIDGVPVVIPAERSEDAAN